MCHQPGDRARTLWASVVAVGIAVLLLAACEPIADPAGDPEETASPPGGDDALGAPAAGMPQSLSDLRQQGLVSAEQWQDAPVLSEIEVVIDADGRWTSAALTYLAADADRMFEYRITTEATSQDRPTLATLGLAPITGDGLSTVPAPPEDLVDPAGLLELAIPQLEACGATGAPTGVLYATGAPISWNGTQWTQALRWTATVTTPDAALVVDPVSGEQLPDAPCVTREAVQGPTEDGSTEDGSTEDAG